MIHVVLTGIPLISSVNVGMTTVLQTYLLQPFYATIGNYRNVLACYIHRLTSQYTYIKIYNCPIPCSIFRMFSVATCAAVYPCRDTILGSTL